MPIHLLVDAADIKCRSSVDLLAIELTFLDGLATILLQHELLHQETRLCRPEDLADQYRIGGSWPEETSVTRRLTSRPA